MGAYTHTHVRALHAGRAGKKKRRAEFAGGLAFLAICALHAGFTSYMLTGYALYTQGAPNSREAISLFHTS